MEKVVVTVVCALLGFWFIVSLVACSMEVGCSVRSVLYPKSVQPTPQCQECDDDGSDCDDEHVEQGYDDDEHMDFCS